MNALDLRAKRGTMQDAAFIELMQILDRPKNREVFTLKAVAVEMEVGHKMK